MDKQQTNKQIQKNGIELNIFVFIKTIITNDYCVNINIFPFFLNKSNGNSNRIHFIHSDRLIHGNVFLSFLSQTI